MSARLTQPPQALQRRTAAPETDVQPIPSGETAQNRPSAPRFASQPGRASIRSVSSAPLPPTRSGRARMASAILAGVEANRLAICESGIANVGTPHPSTPTSASPTSSATRCCSGCSSDREGWSGQPCALQAASMPACLPEQL